ncbi:MAG: hypothetical protein L0312_28530 [Acidobacteria bacterium]|nr:hypothetical protein [Acidobacteriota bacterium]
MADVNKSTQEAEKTAGTQPGAILSGTGTTASTAGSPAGQTSAGQTGQTGSATRRMRDQKPVTDRESTSYSSLGSSMGRGSQTGEEMVDQMRQSVSDAYDRASRSMNRTWEQAVDYSREHPGTATLIAFGAGVGVGLLLASGMTTRSRTRRMVPPIMNVLSEIAREVFH